MNKSSKVLSCVYAHFEAHGPGIYHNELLAKSSGQLDIYYSNVMLTSWVFPDHVRLITDRDNIIPWVEIYKKNHLSKWWFFLKYTIKMFFLIKRNKYDIVVVFNAPTLLSLTIIRFFINKKIKLWYHNYDPIDNTNIKKYSISYFCYRSMMMIFPKLDMFSHSEETRDRFFPLHLLNHQRYILPNYPMIEMHSGNKRELNSKTLRIIFSGVISEGNGLEDLIKISSAPIRDFKIHLILKGFITNDYKNQLQKLILETDSSDYVNFIGVGPWKEVPQILRTAHIGVHIFHKDDIISKTMGKGGSGKVFQYIAEGLPVLMSSGFYENFKEYDWAIPTSLDHKELVSNITYIVDNYDKLSESATNSFKNELNCDKHFDEIFNALI